MAFLNIVVAFTIIATGSTYPTENVIVKMDPGPRYQYMPSPNGLQLVDLWLKTSDVRASAEYDPEINNGYHLFTRSNPTISHPIPLGSDDILRFSHFDPAKKTVFLVHGWQNTPQSDFNVQMINAYLAAEDVNLFMVDWSIGAAGCYLTTLLNTFTSGEHVARFITWLNTASGADLSNYHIIGHSMGAHQAGIISRHLGTKVAYVTVLDPAMPGWILNPNAFNASDGIYTEAIHTNVGLSGLLRPVGDVDFYPNGGHQMPGCSDRSCNHHRCVFYMAESLIQGGFIGQRCDSLLSALTANCTSTDTLRMGGNVAKTGSSGIFYLATNAESPFSQT